LDGLAHRLDRSQRRALEHAGERLALAVGGLAARSPLATLARGYAIVTHAENGAILRDPAEAPPGTVIEARLARGSIRALVQGDGPDARGGSAERL
jgi:exodeoxyribonuclease VII large subunit